MHISADNIIRYCKYLRYSRADGDREIESIKNQERIIDNYVKEQMAITGEKWVHVDTYVDIDYTGLNFMRPDFLRMKKDIEENKIDIILSKDSSRFGRNVASEFYFTELFPKHNTYFIGIIDDVDTREDGKILERQIKGIFNENYSRDISRKVKSAMRAKMAEGKFMGSCEPYGFLRDPDDKHKLIIDEELRPIIKRVADLYLRGNGLQTVARILNDGEKDEHGNWIHEPVMSPTAYKKYRRGVAYHNPNGWKNKWSPSMVKKILSDETYNGVLVQHRTEKVTLKAKKRKKINKDEQIRVEGALEKIFDDETWALIQKRMKMSSKAVANNHTNEVRPGNFFSHLIFCADCGSQMHYRSDREVYICGTYSRFGIKYCTNHLVKKDHVAKVVIEQLQIINKITIEVKEMVEEIKKYNKQKDLSNVVKMKTQKCQKRLNDIENILKLLREERASGEVSEDEYKRTREEYLLEIADLQKELGILNNKLKNNESVINDWEIKITDIEKTYEKYFVIKEMDRETALRLISRININEAGEIVEIEFNGTSPFEVAEEVKRELEAIAI